MIKILRKIRQKLLIENKFKNYLPYAIGEIVLVVIGILIALSINNWNEQNKINKSIHSHLEILKQNLLEDQAQLQNLKENMTENINCADSAMLQIKTIVPANNSMKRYLVILIREFQFRPNTNAIETITQSNEIPNLDDELRTSILNYYALIERTKEREYISNTQIQSKYEPHINIEYPDIFQKDNEWEFLSSFYKNDPRPISSIDEVKLLKDKTLESLLVSRYYQCVNLENFYEELIESSDKILSIIASEEK